MQFVSKAPEHFKQDGWQLKHLVVLVGSRNVFSIQVGEQELSGSFKLGDLQVTQSLGLGPVQLSHSDKQGRHVLVVGL